MDYAKYSWIVFAILFVCSLVFFLSAYTERQEVCDSLGNFNIKEPGLTPKSKMTNSIIYVAAPAETIQTQNSVSDPHFNVDAPGSFVLYRDIEYCQWIEHKNGGESKPESYTYTREWKGSIVPSIGYKESGTKHNHQYTDDRNLAQRAVSTRVTIGYGYVLDENLASEVSVANPTLLMLSPAKLDNFKESPAHTGDNFRYIGDGWFYSSFYTSNKEAEKIENAYAESGVADDSKIKKLFGECTVGDRRVRFTTKKPVGGVSVIAHQVSKSGILTSFASSSDKKKPIVREGIHEKYELMDPYTRELQRSVTWSFVLTVISFVALIYTVGIDAIAQFIEKVSGAIKGAVASFVMAFAGSAKEITDAGAQLENTVKVGGTIETIMHALMKVHSKIRKILHLPVQEDNDVEPVCFPAQNGDSTETWCFQAQKRKKE